MNFEFAQEVTERGWMPDALVRKGIRSLLQQRLQDIGASDPAAAARGQMQLVHSLAEMPIAALPELANEQHYELPTEFFERVLGAYNKYSCGFWPEGVRTLDASESAALMASCRRAGLADGQRILELGCGWGALTLWMAASYPESEIVAVSNSTSQRDHVLQRAAERGLGNVRVITADMNDFTAEGRFDRIVSVEMFEHMRNWPMLFKRVRGWLEPEGRLFMHIFVHRSVPYLFEQRNAADWMSRYFFSGGMMPSLDLPLFFQDDLKLEKRWVWSGLHYEKTANAWLENMDRQRDELWPVFTACYGEDFARLWWVRWRIFFMACAELFAFNAGREWMVGHYLFSPSGVQS